MELTLDLVLLIVAFLCFIAASLHVSWRDVDFVPLGLAFWVLAVIL